MNELVSVRANEYYQKDKEGNMVRTQELVFLVDKALYNVTNQGEINQERGLYEARFSVTDKNLKKLITILEGTLTEEEDDKSN